MRTALLLAACLVVGADAAPAQGSATDYRFTPALHAGQRLSISNIDGSISITQGGTVAEIVAHKIVHRGDGSRVKAIIEQTSDGYLVCAVYLVRGEDRDTCGGNHGNGNDDEALNVDVQFEARVPAGVRLSVHSVDGAITARGIDTPAIIGTVDGDITFDGKAPESLNTVDGRITAAIGDAGWDHNVALRSVDGSVDVTLPAAINVTLTGSSVDGEITSDFPVTLAGKWGPRSMRGTIGSGGTRELRVSTVDGAIRVHRGS
ncbi:MAG: DUF4097 family beta strand repeat-containing protein [Gemmatimonadales bacterium]